MNKSFRLINCATRAQKKTFYDDAKQVPSLQFAVICDCRCYKGPSFFVVFYRKSGLLFSLDMRNGEKLLNNQEIIQFIYLPPRVSLDSYETDV